MLTNNVWLICILFIVIFNFKVFISNTSFSVGETFIIDWNNSVEYSVWAI